MFVCAAVERVPANVEPLIVLPLILPALVISWPPIFRVPPITNAVNVPTLVIFV